MSTRYSHDYSKMGLAKGYDSVALFEKDAADHLRGLKRDNVGGVVLYRDAKGNELAYIDYENRKGSVYALTGLRSDEL